MAVQRQNPAYRLAKERARFGGPFLWPKNCARSNIALRSAQRTVSPPYMMPADERLALRPRLGPRGPRRPGRRDVRHARQGRQAYLQGKHSTVAPRSSSHWARSSSSSAFPQPCSSKTSDRVPSGAGTYTLNSTPDRARRSRDLPFDLRQLPLAQRRQRPRRLRPEPRRACSAPRAQTRRQPPRASQARSRLGGVTGKQMPAGLLSGEDSKLVSQYVAAVAGK